MEGTAVAGVVMECLCKRRQLSFESNSEEKPGTGGHKRTVPVG